MAALDLRGARYDFQVAPPNGIYHEFQYKIDEDTPRSLSGATVKAYLADDEGASVSEEALTVTDAANGVFLLVIPPASFAALWGKEATYVVSALYSGDPAPTPLLYGKIKLLQKY